MSNTNDSSVVYAMLSNARVKGALIDAYGAYAENITPEMAKSFDSDPDTPHALYIEELL